MKIKYLLTFCICLAILLAGCGKEKEQAVKTEQPVKVETKSSISSEQQLSAKGKKGNDLQEANGEKIAMTVEEKKLLDTFFSNFSEAGVQEFALNTANKELIRFGIMHNLINRKQVVKRDGGDWLIPVADAQNAADKYFGKRFVAESIDNFRLEGNYYRTPRAYGEGLTFSQIASFAKRKDNLFEAVVNVYTTHSDFQGDVHDYEVNWKKYGAMAPKKVATFKAVIDKSPVDRNRYILKTYTLIK